MDEAGERIARTAARLKRLYTAAIYDILDELGIEGQCLDLAIKPIERTMRNIPTPRSRISASSAARIQVRRAG